MISAKDQATLREWISEYCDHLSPNLREMVFEKLVNKTGANAIFCVYNGDYVARIGVRFQLEDGVRGSTYISTQYDTDMLDF